MATQSATAVGTAPISLKEIAADERRRETRFGAEGEVVIIADNDPLQQHLSATLLDFSLRGLRVRIAEQLSQGQQVRVFFSWGEVATQVMWTTAVANGQEIGLQLF